MEPKIPTEILTKEVVEKRGKQKKRKARFNLVEGVFVSLWFLVWVCLRTYAVVVVAAVVVDAASSSFRRDVKVLIKHLFRHLWKVEIE